MFTGACLCGAQRYEAQGPLRALVHCHCSMCRKHHGAPFATIAVVPREGFRWLDGEAAVLEYPSSSKRVRRCCGVCGSVAPTPVKDRVLLPAGNLVGDFEAASAQHFFVGSKAPWHVIADALPQHDTLPPGWALDALIQDEVPRPAPLQVEGASAGSCLCGAVTFSVRGAPLGWFQCHCSRCRRGRSAAHGSNAFYPNEQFTWHSGRERVRSYKPPEAARFTVSFCTRCGGAAPVERDNVPFVLIPATLFDADPGARPRAHIFVGSKAPWYEIHDSLPKFVEMPPA